MSATCYSVLGIGNTKYGIRTLEASTVVTYLNSRELSNDACTSSTGTHIQVLSVAQAAIRPLELSNASPEYAAVAHS